MALLGHRSLILLTLSYAAVNYFQYLFFYWMNYYFQTVLALPEATSRSYAAIPPLAMAAGMPLGGWLSDRLERASGTLRTRRVVPMAGMTAGALLLILGAFARSPALDRVLVRAGPGRGGRGRGAVLGHRHRAGRPSRRECGRGVQHRGERRRDARPDRDADGRAILRMGLCRGPGRGDLPPRRRPLVLDRPGRSPGPGDPGTLSPAGPQADPPHPDPLSEGLTDRHIRAVRAFCPLPPGGLTDRHFSTG